MHIASFLTNTASRIPNFPAIRFKGQTITFGQMNSKVDAMAIGLRKMGLMPGDFCVLMMPESPNWPIVYYALAKLGAAVVPVNPIYRQRELEHIFHDSGATSFIGHSDYLTEAGPVLDELESGNIQQLR